MYRAFLDMEPINNTNFKGVLMAEYRSLEMDISMTKVNSDLIICVIFRSPSLLFFFRLSERRIYYFME